MTDVNIKIVASANSKTNLEDRSPYLLNVEVLEGLKDAIRQAKGTDAVDAKTNEK